MKKYLRTLVLMAAMMLPFASQAQDLYDFEDNAIPAGWINSSSYPWVVTNTSQGNGHAGTYCIKSGNSGVSNSESSISVAIDFAMDGSISFLGGIYGEGTSTAWDKCIFMIDGTQQFAYGALGTWSTYTFQVTAGTHTFTWKYTKDGSVNPTGDAFFVDNVVIEGVTIPDCYPVTNLVIVDSLTTTESLTLSWTDTNNSGASYTVYSITSTDTTDLVTGYTGNTYTVNNLSAMTAYTYGVESDCGVAGLGRMKVVNGRTACDVVVIDGDNPFVEGFEAEDFPPACWSTAHTAGSGTLLWEGQTNTVHSGVRSAKLPDQQVGNKTNLVTPPLSIDADNNYRVSFWMYRVASSAHNEGVKVWVNTTPDTIGGTSLIHITRSYQYGDISEETSGWYMYSAIIPSAMAASNFYVIFEGISEYGNYSSLDDVTIDRAPDCLPVANLAIINDSTTAHTATFVWSSDGNSFQVEYKKATDDDWTTDIVSDTTVTLTGLYANTAYNFRVRVLCDDDSSDYSRVIDFTTTVACPAPENLRAILTPGDGTVATIAWNDPTGSAWQICLNGDTNTLIDVEEPSYDLTDLTPETAYTAMVRRDCTDDEEGYSVWTNVITFVPTDAYMLTVNDGTVTNSYVPIYGLWADDHIRSQFIIPASTLEPMTFGIVNSLVFHAREDSISWGAASFNVYLTETGATTVYNLLNVADMTQVYSGTLSIRNSKMVVSFDSTINYQYMGGNLLIAFEEPTSGSFVNCTWYGVDATAASMGGYGTSLDQQDFLPKTTIYFTPGDTPDCLPVSNLIIVDSLTTSDSLTISWTDEANSGATYTIYDLSGGDTIEVATIADDSYTFDELAPNTMYTFGVVANCGSDEAIMRVIAGTTACGRVEAPHTWDFEGLATNNTPDCWTTVGSGYAYVVSANSHGGTNAIQFSGSTSNILVLPELAAEANTLQMKFWLSAQSNTASSGNFDVGYMTDITNPSTFVVLDSYNYTEFFTTGSSAYGQRTVMFAGVPDSVRIALRAAPTASYYYWYVDDVTIEELPSCVPVSRLIAVDTSITAESITISWLSDATDFIVLNMADSSVLGTTSETSYLIEDLTPTTAYTFGVVVDCGGEYSDTITLTVNTACAAIPIPYYETFEPGNPTINCWTMANVATNTGFGVSNGIGNGGCFMFAYNTNPPQYLVSPELSGTDDDSILVEFRYKAASATWPESFALGYSTTTNATESFTWLPEVTNIVNLDYEIYSRFLPEGVKYVCIKYTANDRYYLYIDSLYLGLPPTCLPVTGLTVTSVDESSATISWNSSADSYSVYDGATYVGTTTDTTYTINGLTASTAYTFGVRAICTTDDSAMIATTSVTTPCSAVNTFPFEEHFSVMPDCWTLIDADGDGQNWFIFQSSDGTAFTIQSASYNSVELTPDNWLVTPPLAIPATGGYEVTWTATGQDQSWPAEHYGIFVSTTAPVPSAFTMLQEWTLGPGVFHPVIDLSAYAGQTIYIALRHFNCTNNFRLSIDDFIVRAQAGSNEVTINVNTNNPAYGNVSGSGIYTIGDNVSVNATAASGYTFDRWVDVDNVTISTDNPYTFVAATDLDLTAVFLDNTTTYTITVQVNDSTMGTATGGGIYTAGDFATLEATPNPGYRFVNWTQSSGFGINVISDEPTINVTVTSDKTFIANFEADSTGVVTEDTLTVTLAVNDATLGSVAPAAGVYNYAAADSVVYSATPATGSVFVAWYVVYDNGTTDSIFTARYAMLAGSLIDNGVRNMTVTAVFRSTVGIDGVSADMNIFSTGNRIVVRGAEGEDINIYDLSGRTVATKANAGETMEFAMESGGVYMVKVGNAPAKRVLVVR